MKKIVSPMLPFFMIVCLQSMAANFAHPVTPTIIQNLGLGDYMFGLAFAGMAGTSFLFSPFWGKLADYVQSRTILLICNLGYAVGQILFSLGTTEVTIMMARFVSGFFVGGVNVCMLTYTVNMSAPEQRGSHLTIQATAVTVAGTFGYMIGGVLGEVSVNLAFGMQALCLSLSAFLFFFLLKNDRTDRQGHIPMGQVVRNANPFAAFLSAKQFMTMLFGVLFVVVFMINFAFTAYDQCFNYYIKDQFGFSSMYNGFIKAAIGLISLLANMTLCMYIIRKTDTARSEVKVLLVSAIALFGAIIGDAVVPFILLTVVYLSMNAVSVPVLQSIVADRAPHESSNIVMGFYNAIRSFGQVWGATFAGFAYSAGPKVPFLWAGIALIIGGLGTVVYIILSHRRNETCGKA
ncbi:MAG TPA: MFS transporter [Candidatus Faecimorpha stercoravium]|nr:MFS transporter [Candidatus Faecimorpha stercoravium]